MFQNFFGLKLKNFLTAMSENVNGPTHTLIRALGNMFNSTYCCRYTLRNVARCWTYETSLLVDEEIDNKLPDNDYYAYFAPDYKLHPEIVTRQENANSKQYLELIVKHTYDNLKMVQHSPSVQMHNTPGDLLPNMENAMIDDLDPDVRAPQVEEDKKVDPANEFYDDEQDQDKNPVVEEVT